MGLFGFFRVFRVVLDDILHLGDDILQENLLHGERPARDVQDRDPGAEVVGKEIRVQRGRHQEHPKVRTLLHNTPAI